jgi:hypothetical protein
MRTIELLGIGIAVLGWIGTAQASASDQQKCIGAKLAAAGKYAACRAGADKKAELSETTADYAKCDQKQLDAWSKIEERYGARCLTSGDQAGVKTEVSAMTQCLVDRLSPAGLAPLIQVECIPCPSNGVVVDGTCWILGAAGDSCTAACAIEHMTYDDKTDTYASPTASNTGHCLFIMDQFGHPYSQSAGSVVNGPAGYGVGCAFSGRPYLCPGPATAQGTFSGFQRLCACH